MWAVALHCALLKNIPGLIRCGASAPVSNALKRLGLRCLQPIDLLRGAGIDVLCPEQKQRLRKVCASGIVGLALAAPPCGAFSLVRLKPGGPRPVRSPQFPDGLPPAGAAPSSLSRGNCMSLRASFCLWSPCEGASFCLRTQPPP